MLIREGVLAREDLVAEYLHPLIDRMFEKGRADTLSLMTQCRQLRFLLFYGPILS